MNHHDMMNLLPPCIATDNPKRVMCKLGSDANPVSLFMKDIKIKVKKKKAIINHSYIKSTLILFAGIYQNLDNYRTTFVDFTQLPNLD